MAGLGRKGRHHLPGAWPEPQARARDGAAGGGQAHGNSRFRPHPADALSSPVGRKHMRRHRLRKYVVLAVLAVATPVSAESLLDKLLRVSGLTATPAQMRPAGDTVEAGN